MKRTYTGRFARTAIAVACSLTAMNTYSRLAVTDPDAPPPKPIAPLMNPYRTTAIFDGPRGGDIVVNDLTAQGLLMDEFGVRDFGKWLCTNCALVPQSPTVVDPFQIAQLVDAIKGLQPAVDTSDVMAPAMFQFKLLDLMSQ